MPRQTRLQLAILGVAALGLALFPLVAETYYLRLVTRIMIIGLFALSLDLLVGYAGLVSLGHAAFFGAAAYTVALMVNKLGITDAPTLLLASLVVAAVVALVIGFLSIRTSGVYFIMITLALAQMLYYFVKDRRDWGGTDGMNIDTKPVFEWLGVRLIDFYDRPQFYYLVLACLVGAFVLLSVMLAAPSGGSSSGFAPTKPAPARSATTCSATSSSSSSSPACSPASRASSRRRARPSSTRSISPGTNPATC